MIFGPTHSCCWSKKSRQKKMTERYSEKKIPSCEEWYKPVSSHIHGSRFLKKQNNRSWKIPFFFRNLELTSKIIWWNKYYRKQSILFYFMPASRCSLPCLLLQIAVLRKPKSCASYVRHVVRKRLGWGITVPCTSAFERYCHFLLTSLSLLYRKLSYYCSQKTFVFKFRWKVCKIKVKKRKLMLL